MELGDDQVLFLPNGELNVPFVLSNANLLYSENEIELAFSLYARVKNHPKYGFSGHYGIGRCFKKLGQYRQALQAFEKAYSLAKRTYIANSICQTLFDCGEFALAEARAIEFAIAFASDPASIEMFRTYYQKALEKNK